MLNWIVQKNWCAVGETLIQGNTGDVGDQSVRFTEHPTSVVSSHHHHSIAVNLKSGGEMRAFDAKGLRPTPVIRLDIGEIIAHCRTQIEAIPRCRADATQPGEHRMPEPRKTVE
jgi:hypothetical protein